VKKSFIQIYFILLLILTSGTVFFSLAYSKVFTPVLFISSLLLLYSRRRISKDNLKILVVFFVFLFINVIFNFTRNVAYSSVIGLAIKVTSISIIFSELDINDFKKCYVNIMAVLCVISLVCFFSSEQIQNITYPLMSHKIIAGNWFTYAPYHTWGWETAFHRNAGMFWEPGAFQAFINIALLILINDKSKIDWVNDKRTIVIFILFMGTILSTKSTTGYIILCMIFLYGVIKNLSEIKTIIVHFRNNINKKSIIYIVVLIVFLLGTVTIIFNNGVITKKLTKKNDSYSIRSNDLNSSLKIIATKPLVGYGYMSKAVSEVEKSYNIKDNSNGLLYFTYMFGIPVVATLLFLYYKGLKTLLPNVNPGYSLIVLILIFMSEYLMLMPLYLALTFRLSQSECKYIYIGKKW